MKTKYFDDGGDTGPAPDLDIDLSPDGSGGTDPGSDWSQTDPSPPVDTVEGGGGGDVITGGQRDPADPWGDAVVDAKGNTTYKDFADPTKTLTISKDGVYSQTINGVTKELWNPSMAGGPGSLMNEALKSLFVDKNGKPNLAAIGGIATFLTSSAGKKLLGTAEKPPVGYQGGIPSLTSVRERVQHPDDPNRRPGSGGRRYFSDTTYVPKPTTVTTPATAAVAATENSPAVAARPAVTTTNSAAYDAARAAAATQAEGLRSLLRPTPTPASTGSKPQQVFEDDPNPRAMPLPIVGLNSYYEEPPPAQPLPASGVAQLLKNDPTLPPIGLASGRYLGGASDGMADKIPANIDGKQEARLSHGEFVLPADVVSHLGNGNSEAGAQRLYAMMDKIRQARTGSAKQGRQINPDKYLPAKFNAGGGVPDPTAGKQVSTDSTLSNWAGPYVTDMLGKGAAAASTPYEAFSGPLTAGASDLQNQAFQGISNLAIPTAAQTTYNPQTFTAEAAQRYMNPFLMAGLQPQIDEARRQAQMEQLKSAGSLSRAGAFGGSRQAIMDAEGTRNLLKGISDITGKGYSSAYDKAMEQFNTEQNRGLAAAKQAGDYGLSALAAQKSAGETQRGIESEGIAADMKQFQEERDYPYKQVQFQQSLLKDLPGVASANYNYQGAGGLSELLGSAGGILGFLKALGYTTPG